MAADGMMRASDADRDAVVDVLRDAYTDGRLTLEEFGERTSAAYAGRTWGELRELTADLPGQPALGADLPGSGLGPRPAPTPDVRLPPGAPRRPPRPAGSVMPFVMVWFLLMLAARSDAVIVAPVMIVTILLLVTAISRRR